MAPRTDSVWQVYGWGGAGCGGERSAPGGGRVVCLAGGGCLRREFLGRKKWGRTASRKRSGGSFQPCAGGAPGRRLGNDPGDRFSRARAEPNGKMINGSAWLNGGEVVRRGRVGVNPDLQGRCRSPGFTPGMWNGAAEQTSRPALPGSARPGLRPLIARTIHWIVCGTLSALPPEGAFTTFHVAKRYGVLTGGVLSRGCKRPPGQAIA